MPTILLNSYPDVEANASRQHFVERIKQLRQLCFRESLCLTALCPAHNVLLLKRVPLLECSKPLQSGQTGDNGQSTERAQSQRARLILRQP
mmetsp:Transcript_104995/g.145204  ORF Transcript_104995/g.145204 Transcript_104995/m.145204 type:complete len:91 (-) Transcript_104995:221-493(-)